MTQPRYNFDPLYLLLPENVPARKSQISYITKLRCRLEHKFSCAGPIPMVFTRTQAINVIREMRLKLA